MKTLIAYASKTGTAEKCARMLAERIPDSTLCDLCKEKPDPSAYDQVIVGGGVRMGALHVDARQYLDGCKPILLQKRLACFSAQVLWKRPTLCLKTTSTPNCARTPLPATALAARSTWASCAALKS